MNTRIGFHTTLLLATVLAAGQSARAQTDLSNVWIYPSQPDQRPVSLSVADWLIGAKDSSGTVTLKGESGSYSLSAPDYSLLLINAGGKGLPVAGANYPGPQFSLSGIKSSPGLAGNNSPAVQIDPARAVANESLRVTVHAQAPGGSGVVELLIRVLCGASKPSTLVSSNPADYTGSGSCAVPAGGQTGPGFAAQEVILLDNQFYRVDAMARMFGAVSYSKPVSKDFQVSGADPLSIRDSDGDGIPDIVELELGFDLHSARLDRDSDGDGWSDFDEWLRCAKSGVQECQAGTPADSDGDGWSDVDEIWRKTDPQDFIGLDQDQLPIPQPWGSQPTAQRLYEVEYRIKGAFFEDEQFQNAATHLTELSLVDAFGTRRFAQTDLPNFSNPVPQIQLKALGPVLESDIAVWNRASLYASELDSGTLPILGDGTPVMRVGGGTAAILRARQYPVGLPLERSPLVLVKWLEGTPDPSPSGSGCVADLSAADIALSWRSCYVDFLGANLVRDLDLSSAPNAVNPRDTALVAFWGALLDWVEGSVQNSESVVLPGHPTLPLPENAVARLLDLMPDSLGEDRLAILIQRIQQLSQGFGPLSGLAASIVTTVENYPIYLLNSAPPNTTQSHAAEVLKHATDAELYPLRLAVLLDEDAFNNANFDGTADVDADGIIGAQEVAVALRWTDPTRADTDGDGQADNLDSCPRDAQQRCLLASSADTDGDGVVDGVDNCPRVANSDQRDRHSHPEVNGGYGNDGIGDACAAATLAAIVQPGGRIGVPVGVPVTFRAQITETAAGSRNGVALHWDFADGTSADNVRDLVHVFKAAGLYRVVLSATEGSSSSMDSVEVEVFGQAGAAALVLWSNISLAESSGESAIPIELSQALPYDVVFGVESRNGTALAGDDFAAVNATVTIPAGIRQATVSVHLVNDGMLEGSENFALNLSVLSGDVLVLRPDIQVEIVDSGQVNRAPTAADDAFVLLEDAPPVDFDVLGNDVDPDGDALSLLGIGAATDAQAGAFSIAAGMLRYAPAPDYSGVVSLTYTVVDPSGAQSSAIASFTVQPVNDPPTPQNDVFTVAESATGVALDVLANDTDVDDGSLLVVSVTAGSAGGNLSIASDGSRIVYSPLPNFAGQELFDYVVEDSQGAQATGSGVITVGGVNDNPVAAADSIAVAEDSAATLIDVLANDSDADNDSLSIGGLGMPDNASAGLFENLGTSVRFTPARNFHGAVSISYTLLDGQGGSATGRIDVTVTPVNDAPTAVEDSVSVLENSVDNVIAVLGNDNDVDGDALVITAAFGASGQVTIATDKQSLLYTPPANYSGSDSFAYTIRDPSGVTATANVFVTIGALNRNPVALDDSFGLNEDDPATALDVLGNDSDPDGNALRISGTGTVVPLEAGSITNLTNQLSFLPAANFHGTATVSYTVIDGAGGSATATATINVAAVNDAPVAVDDSALVAAEGTVEISVLLNDGDIDGDALSIANFTATENSALVMQAGDVLRYTAPTGFSGLDTFSYTVTDGVASGSATVSVTVNPPTNRAPVAVEDNYSVREGVTVELLVLANDSDPDGDALSLDSLDTGSTQGQASITGSVVVYTAPVGAGSDNVGYQISDTGGLTASAFIMINITPNTAPVANADSPSLLQDSGTQTLAVLTNDNDADGDPLTISSVSAVSPANAGQVSISGDGLSLIFTPAAGYYGGASFDYTVGDAHGGTATATVTLTVTALPGARDDLFDVVEDSYVALAVLANDTPASGGTLTVTSVKPLPSSTGSFKLFGGALSYSPARDAFGAALDAADYTVTDSSNSQTYQARITINVLPQNDRPTFTNVGFGECVRRGSGPVSIPGWVSNISVGPANEADQTATFVVQANSNPGVFSTGPAISSDGTLSFTPNTLGGGLASVSFVLQDDGGTANGGQDTSTASRAFQLLVQDSPARDSVCLSLLDGTDGLVIQGELTNGALGHVVRPLGDINADGRPDVALAGIGASFGGYRDVPILFGAAASPSSPLLESTLPRLTGVYSQNAPIPIDGVGDVTGDAVHDLIVGEPAVNTNASPPRLVPQVRIIAGGAGIFVGSPLAVGANTAVYTIVGRPDIRPAGTTLLEPRFGMNVAGLGDVNADGKPDFGILSQVDDGTFSLRAYVIYGGSTNLAALDALDAATDGVIHIEQLTGKPALGFIVEGELLSSGGTTSTSILPILRRLGRFNGDAVDDFAIAMPHARLSSASTDANKGRVMVVMGGSSLPNPAGATNTLRAADLTGPNGFVIDGTAANQVWGRNLAGGLDINGDGLTDLASSRNNGFGEDVTIIYGQNSFTNPSIDLGTVTMTSGLRITCNGGNACAAVGLNFLDDVNGDGNPDMGLQLGTANEYGITSAGRVRILFGGSENLTAVDLADGTADGKLTVDSLSAGQGQIVSGYLAPGGGQNYLGFGADTISRAGDLNGDGRPDYIIGAPQQRNATSVGVGEAYVLYGFGP